MRHEVLPAPLDDAELFARLRLARSRRVGPATFRRLLAEHGTARNALTALPEIARSAGVAGYEAAPVASVRAELSAGRKAGARLLTPGAPGYPARLSQIADPPPILWAQGDPALADRPAIAIVGTRNASSLALRMARALAQDLASEGILVVSGLARGVDTAAHAAALKACGGTTAAIHAGGLDRVYPPENRDLAARIAAEGLALSERPFGYAPQGRDFPRRNRIVSGLAQVVVVVEAAARSGSMITARDALDQGREIAAVPGHPFDTRASGCNLLLRDGATLVRGARDVLDLLEAPAQAGATAPAPAPSPAPAASPYPEGGGLRLRILSLLSPVPVSEDQLLRDLAESGPATAPALAAQLSEMELTGEVARRPGGGLVRL